jgi:hypothetical protein
MSPKTKEPKAGQTWLLPPFYHNKRLMVTRVNKEFDKVFYLFDKDPEAYVDHEQFELWILEKKPRLIPNANEIWKELNEGKENEKPASKSTKPKRRRTKAKAS